MKQLLSTAWRMLADWMDPVCQNRAAVLFGQHRGHYVRLRPLVGRSGRVETWVPDPTDAERIDRILASGAAPAPTLPTPSAPFNPAGVSGI